MITLIIKEIKQNRLLIISGVLLSFLPLFLSYFIKIEGGYKPSDIIIPIRLLGLLIIVFAFPFFIGNSVISTECEKKTDSFLAMLPIKRDEIWLSKFISQVLIYCFLAVFFLIFNLPLTELLHKTGLADYTLFFIFVVPIFLMSIANYSSSLSRQEGFSNIISILFVVIYVFLGWLFVLITRWNVLLYEFFIVVILSTLMLFALSYINTIYRFGVFSVLKKDRKKLLKWNLLGVCLIYLSIYLIYIIGTNSFSVKNARVVEIMPIPEKRQAAVVFESQRMGDKRLFILDIDKPATMQKMPGNGYSELSYNPQTGEILCFKENNQYFFNSEIQKSEDICVIDLKNKKVRKIARNVTDYRSEPSNTYLYWINNSKNILYADYRQSPANLCYTVFDLEGNEVYSDTAILGSVHNEASVLNIDKASSKIYIAKPPRHNTQAIWEIDVLTGKIKEIAKGEEFFILNGGLSPSGRYLVYEERHINKDGYEVLNYKMLDLKENKACLIKSGKRVGRVLWGKDDKKVYLHYAETKFSYGDKGWPNAFQNYKEQKLLIYEIGTGKKNELDFPTYYDNLVLSPNRDSVITIDYKNKYSMVYYDLESYKKKVVLDNLDNNYRYVWLSDTEIIFCKQYKEIYLLNTETGESRKIFPN